MEENFKNKLGFWCFVIIVLFLLIGGYFFMNYALNDHKSQNNKKGTEVSYKIDKKKDYIYFENEKVVSEKAEIIYKDIIINLKGQEVLTETLNKTNAIYQENIQYLKDITLLDESLIKYNNDDLYALTYRKYDVYEYDNYVSLLVNDYNYSCFDLTTFNKVKGYVFNTDNGKELSEKELFALYDTNMESIKNKIREELTKDQTVNDEGIEVIKIDETINNLDNYGLYINEFGRLYISYLVKTNEVDYNKSMEVK